MNPVWRRELRRTLIVLAIAIAIGHQFGFTLEAVTFAFALYIGWNWLQLYRLHQWLEQGRSTLLPRTLGIWGAIFADTQRLQQKSVKDQQRLQAVINRIQDSTAALKDSVMMVDASGALEFWNQAAQKHLGLRSPVDIGQPITHLIRNPEFREYFEKAEYNEPLTIPSPLNPKVHLQFNITLFGRKDRLILVHDVSRLKQLEEMRKDFVANVSHELRTPLTVISGYVETLQMGAEQMPPRWQRMLQQMGEQSRRMENLIKDLLMLSRLETTRHEQTDKVNLRPMLESIQTDSSALSSGLHRVVLDMKESDVILEGYYNELRSALSNLAFNAVKYSPDGGEIRLSWEQKNGKGYFSVSDQGMGIAPHHIPRLTERFYRADASRNNATGGTGLGLAIVKHVLLRHDGYLEITSEEGKGSTFTCVFPAGRFKTLER